jgi:hypothetical protein
MKMRLHWGTGIVLVYVTFAAATLAFVAFAIAHPAALVTDHYYQDATRHDERMAAIANAKAVGADVRVVGEGADRVALLEVSPQHAGRSQGTVTWYRASDASADRVADLAIDDAGRQRLSMDGLAAGHWRLKVQWEVDGRPFYLERVILVR